MSETGKVSSPTAQRSATIKNRVELTITYGTPVLVGVGGVFAGQLLAKKFADKFPTGKKWFMIGGLIAGLGLGYYVSPKINGLVNS